MDIVISNRGGVPIYEQITRQIKALIASGELREGDALPSMRLLANELRISVITTKRAYEELERDGYIISMTGRGSFVAPADKNLIREEHLRRIEGCIDEAVMLAKSGGITAPELCEMVKTAYGDDN